MSQVNRTVQNDAFKALQEVDRQIRDLQDIRAYLHRTSITGGEFFQQHIYDGPLSGRAYKWHGDRQRRIAEWVIHTFGEAVLQDRQERINRFMEEACELAQSVGMTHEACVELVNYVFLTRCPGVVAKEAADAMITLYALAASVNVPLDSECDAQLETLPARIESIRAKQALKPKF